MDEKNETDIDEMIITNDIIQDIINNSEDNNYCHIDIYMFIHGLFNYSRKSI